MSDHWCEHREGGGRFALGVELSRGRGFVEYHGCRGCLHIHSGLNWLALCIFLGQQDDPHGGHPGRGAATCQQCRSQQDQSGFCGCGVQGVHG